MQKQWGIKLGRITGLDPSGPLFGKSVLNSTNMLSATDARFVDVYYTSRGKFGHSATNVGTITVYINGGGLAQPGCLLRDLSTYPQGKCCPVNIAKNYVMFYNSIIELNIGYCSHDYAWEVYNAGFESDYMGYPCTNECTCRVFRCFAPKTKIGILIGPYAKET